MGSGQLSKKRLVGLSRNLLVIVCEYLAFFEIVTLVSTNKKLLNKLDDFFDPNGGCFGVSCVE